MSSINEYNKSRNRTHKITLVKLPLITIKAHPKADKKALRTAGKRLQYGAMYSAGPSTLSRLIPTGASYERT